MKNFRLFIAILLVSLAAAKPSLAMEYLCMPAAIDTYFGTVPLFSLNIDTSIDDSDNEPIEYRIATFYRVRNNQEELLFYGEETSTEAQPDALSIKYEAYKFQSETDGDIYIEKRLLNKNAGDVIRVLPKSLNQKRLRYQCSLRN